MSTLNPNKLHVKFIGDSDPDGPKHPRKYTLTHSDRTGELFLSVGTEFDHDALAGIYNRFMRDEVLAEFLQDKGETALHVYCHVSGGLILGSASWRYAIFQRHLRQVLQAFYMGDEIYLNAYPRIKRPPVVVHFLSSNQGNNLEEDWGYLSDYHLPEAYLYATT
jgi:hypothetical protein